MADSTANIMNFFKMSLFLAALPAELCTIVNLHDQNDMTIKKMYKIATILQREDKDSKRIAALDTAYDSDQDKEEVAVFWKCHT